MNNKNGCLGEPPDWCFYLEVNIWKLWWMHALSYMKAFQAVHVKTTAPSYILVHVSEAHLQICCDHLPECCWSPVMTEPLLVLLCQAWTLLGLAQSETLKSFENMEVIHLETSGSSSWVARTLFGVLACIVLYSCSHLCPKVRQAPAGSLTAGGTRLHLGLCWCQSHWGIWREKPEQTGHALIFPYFPVISG